MFTNKLVEKAEYDVKNHGDWGGCYGKFFRSHSALSNNCQLFLFYYLLPLLLSAG